MSPLISILIATKGRRDELERLLDGLRQLDSRESIGHEVIVANNAADESIANAVEELVKRHAESEPERWVHAREPIPGKSRALNRAIHLARGEILGFLDDDVEVTPSWLRAIDEFFRRYSFDVMQGSILIPPAMIDNPGFLKLLNRYRTICFYQKPGMEVREIDSVNAANIAVRRELFSRTGLFDERIGPGQSGTSMDVEFGERVLKVGGHIGYEPRSVVYHNVDWSRLTEHYFRLRHEMQGRSRLIYKQSTLLTILPNFLRAMWAFGWYSLLNNERKKYRAKGRYFHYRAMIQAKMNAARSKIMA
ncbi:MAG: glycosyltransferase family 2 protein [Deltaproteobacteria bacterium]|nr:MAG: glycosyltransferase family 2 protein [Deltaproteobacteria bacterium]